MERRPALKTVGRLEVFFKCSHKYRQVLTKSTNIAMKPYKKYVFLKNK